MIRPHHALVVPAALVRLGQLFLIACLVAVTAPRVALAEGVNLTWSNCSVSGIPNRLFSCATNVGSQQLVVSFVPPPGIDDLVAVQANITMHTDQAVLPPWWHFEPGGCRAGYLTLQDNFSTFGDCTPVWQGVPSVPSLILQYPVQLPNRGHIQAVTSINSQSVSLDPNTEYYAVRITISNLKTIGSGACSGCTEPVCLYLERVVLSRASGGTVEVAGRISSPVATWNGAICPTAAFAPTITTFSPSSGRCGTFVTINGSNFGNPGDPHSARVSAVYFGGMAPSNRGSFSILSPTQIGAYPPANFSTGPIIVVNTFGDATSVGTFTRDLVPPTVAGFTPAGGPPGTVVTITGTALTCNANVSFNGTPASRTIISDTQISAIVPAGATTGPIQVDNPDGSASSLTNFVVGVPTIASFSPAGGGPGTFVTITGTGFASVTDVRFGDATAAFVVNSDTQIDATAPPSVTSGPLTATNPAGTGVSPYSFNVCAGTDSSFEWSPDPALNSPVSNPAANQSAPFATADGADGLFVVWQDTRRGNDDIYAARLSASGALPPGWPANGQAVCAEPNAQTRPVVVPDGAGGAIVVWEDRRGGDANIYAQRVDPCGTAQWPLGGVAICAAVFDQLFPVAVSDGMGGAIISWEDHRGGGALFDIYTQRVDAQGATLWGADGAPVGFAARTSSAIAADGAGGAFFTWRHDAQVDGFILAQRFSASGSPLWNYPNGVSVSVPGTLPRVESDGLGGAIIVWSHLSNGQVYAQRLNGSGVLQWTPGGVHLTSFLGAALEPAHIADGSGGAIVTWQDLRGVDADIYAQRVDAGGTLRWSSTGVRVCGAPYYQQLPGLVADGSGGAIVTWQDHRGGAYADIYAQRLSGSGTALWTPDGEAISVAPFDQFFTPADQLFVPIVQDGRGGAAIAWTDLRNANNDIYAQRIHHFGILGNPEPLISSVRDVPNDQGGRVRISWSPSYLDGDPSFYIDSYEIWRLLTQEAAALAMTAGAELFDEPNEIVQEAATLAATRATAAGAATSDAAKGIARTIRMTIEGTETLYWEFVAAIPAHGFPAYSYVTPTTQDSMAGSNPYEVFVVIAQDSRNPGFYTSLIYSGYSVDNLAPAAPVQIFAQYDAGSTTLHWTPSSAPDFHAYRLYRTTAAEPALATDNPLRGSTESGSNDLVAELTDTSYVDAAGQPFNYRLSVVDTHGNEGVSAFIQPLGTTDVVGPLPRSLRLGLATPNPAASATVFRLELPAKAEVRAHIYDANGRRVEELVGRSLPAGEHPIRWDLKDAARKPVAAGIYFLRLDVNGQTFRRRFAVIR